MQSGPAIKLAVDIQKISKYFPVDFSTGGSFQNSRKINRHIFEKVQAFLQEYNISDQLIIQEFCFILLWIAEEIGAGNDRDNPSGRHYEMWRELSDLKDYFQKYRITAINLKGEVSKNKPGAEFTLEHPANIDRLCDGIRWAFNNDFHHKKAIKGRLGQSSWERKKMSALKNNFLKYLDSIPELEPLSIETQLYIIGYVSALAGYFLSEEEFRVSHQMSKKYVSYKEYLIQNVKGLK